MQTGVIGLGAMGAYMALNFHKAGSLHRIWNRSQEKAEAIAEETGVEIADSPEQLAEECELIITCVSRDEDVLSVIESISTTIKPGTIVVDTSTISAESDFTKTRCTFAGLSGFRWRGRCEEWHAGDDGWRR